MFEYKRILGERVRDERKKRHLTQVQLAHLVHSNKRTILDIENYRGNPKLETLFELLTYLEIDPYIVFFPESLDRSEGLKQMELLLHTCPEDQIKMLVPICKSIIAFANFPVQVSATISSQTEG